MFDRPSYNEGTSEALVTDVDTITTVYEVWGHFNIPYHLTDGGTDVAPTTK